MSEHIVTPKTYLVIFGALMVLTAVTVLAALVDLGFFNIIVAMVIALSKAVLVVLIFMHVKYSRRIVPLVIGGGLFWLGILIVLTMTDFLSRDWLPAPTGF